MIDYISQIKAKVTCTEYLLSKGVVIGRNNRCVSPLREGAKNPTSFLVQDDHWYDFGSGQGGDVIDLAAQMEYGGDIGRAVRGLASQLHIIMPQKTNNTAWKNEIQKLCNRTAYYQTQLTQSDYDYLEGRGLSKDDIKRLKIGRVTDGYLKGRLFLPYFKNGYVCYYATRALPGSTYPDSKYMKASMNECQYYENVPWGLWTLSRNSTHDMLVISEGYFDAVAWEVSGYPVLSPITGRFSREQWPSVLDACRMFKKVLIIFDNDRITHAGDRFTESTALTLFQNHIPFMVGHTPDDPDIKDVSDYFQKYGEVESLIDTATDGLQFFADRCKSAEELFDFLTKINRFTPSVRLASVIASQEGKYSKVEIASIKRGVEKAPIESIIVDEIIDKHHMIYIDQVGFYEWDGRIWKKQPDSMIRNYADTQYGKIFATAQRVNNVCQLLKARSIRDVVFDRNPVITFQNGTLEINTGVFRNFNPTDYCSIMMNYEYDAKAECPKWQHFITDVTAENPIREEILQYIAGYILFPTCKHQKVFILTGSGGNGKSVYLEIIQKLFGDDNVTHVEPTGLAQEFQRIRLKDSLMNIGTDINSNFSNGEIREWLLKIADGTSVQACYKGMNHIDFIPRCKLIYATNTIPTAEVAAGLNRRMLFVDFPCKYVEYPDPKDPLQKPRDIDLIPKLLEELPGIFNWAYRGFQSLTEPGNFTDAPEQAEFMKQFEQSSNPIAIFVEDTPYGGEVSRSKVYDDYRTWCEATGHKPLARERFLPRFREALGTRLTGEYRKRINGENVRCFEIEPTTESLEEPAHDFTEDIQKFYQQKLM